VIYQWAGELWLGYPLLLVMGEDFVHRLARGVCGVEVNETQCEERESL
jgi:hypothetical protein